MKPENLWVICDMLSEPGKAEEAVAQLEQLLAPAVENDLGSDSTLYIALSPVERFLQDLNRAGLSQPDQLQLISTLTGNPTDLLKHKDAALARRAGTVLVGLAQVSAKLVGSDAVLPTQHEANRAMNLLSSMIRTLGPDIGLQPVGEQPERRRRPRNYEGGIFDGSIFGDSGDDF